MEISVNRILLTLSLFMVFSFAAANESFESNIGSKVMANDTMSAESSTSQDFLSKISQESGMVKTDSGLIYKVIKEGAGASPTASERVEVNYEGKLTNGKVFDSSYQRGSTATFGVSDVISGWTEALQLMKAGSVWELYIPADLAYGARGVPGAIPPNSVLIFKVDLISIK
jgi:FKBP-type peptidyl-prolyl cis-trans isomerase